MQKWENGNPELGVRVRVRVRARATGFGLTGSPPKLNLYHGTSRQQITMRVWWW